MKKLLNKHTALILVVVIFIMPILAGCEFLMDLFNPFSAQFSASSLNFTLGESKEITFDDFNYTGNTSSVSFTLSSSNDQVVAISGHQLSAVGEGSCRISASFSNGTSASVDAYVSKIANEITLMSRDRSKSVTDKSAVEVYAIVNDGKVSATRYDIEWEIDGEKIENYTGEVYVLAQTNTPVTQSVKATVKNSSSNQITDTIKINRYQNSSANLELTVAQGSLNQTAGSEGAVVFTYQFTNGNSYEPVVDWFVNDELVQSDQNSFSFTPNGVGQYEVSVVVNDVKKSKTVKVSGAKIPQNLKVDYDTYYPNVKVTWEGSGAENETYTVNVDGNETTVSKEEYTFSANSYRLNTAHTIKVKSNGNGDFVSASQYSNAYTTPTLASTAMEYLNKKWYAGNYYITSDNEFCEIYDYFMLYREQPTNGKTSAEHKVYMAYNSTYSLASLVDMAFDRPNYTGRYNLGYRQSGSIVTLTFEFETLSYPTTIGTPEQNKQFNGLDLHIANTTNTALPVDEWENTAEVATTDQLYKVVEHGYRPLPVAQSRAEEYYDYAKNLLSKIISPEMTDAQKAHAIYDWIMWRVIYDDKATSISDLADATAYGAFYIEGVLTNSYYTAVCDGMSKAYSLLANMCGLKCYRVVGTAKSSSTSPAGGHAWNKVLIDGEWFVVDCTWGDQRIGVSTGTFGTAKEIRESASHDYIFKTDAQIASTHFELRTANYPSTTALPYNIYNETSEMDLVYNGVSYSSYITSGSQLSTYATALANYVSSSFNYNSNRQRTYVVAGTTYAANFVMKEVSISPLIASNIESFVSTLKQAVKSKNGINCATVIDGNKIIVLASKTSNIK